MDEESGYYSSICLIYEYQGKVFGRILVTYDEEWKPNVPKDTWNDPDDTADKIVGDPYYAGLDFIWDMQDRGRKWTRGKIIDPKPGKIYGCELWIDGENLIVRGKIGPFGRSQTWLPITAADLPDGVPVPDPATLVPVIPRLK